MKAPAVAIVGAGASGALTALHLLSVAEGPRVFLIERRPGFGPGTAYSTGNPDHLLNVRAAHMSAFPDQPGHFLDWLKEHGPGPVKPTQFVARRTYGDYLRGLLRDAASGPRAAGRLMLVNDEAVGLAVGGGKPRLRLGVGRELRIDALVVATGNPIPDAPPIPDNGVFSGPHYVADPWAEPRTAAALDMIGPDQDVLLLGTGLTMVDVALSLEQRGHRGRRIAMSRRGLLPHRHGAPPAIPPGPLPDLPGELSAAMRLIRDRVREPRDAFGRGGDWRQVVDALRPVTRAYWQSLDEERRRRFLRHLRPWWDIHRHRLAPEVADRLTSQIERGRLQVVAGRPLCLLAETGGSIAVHWRPRGGGHRVTQVGAIINCTGPGSDPFRNRIGLLGDLLAHGIARPGPLGLGLDVDADGRLVSADGDHGRFYAVGPPTRGAFWESTAIPDIRVQAQRTARAILHDLR